jgi:hypothetical protein
MSSDWVIGALAFITIGGTLGLAIFHFGFQLRSPANREAAKRVAEDRASATTRMSNETHGGRSLRQRLDEAPGINDRLSDRYVGGDFVEVLLERKWSELRPALGPVPDKK